MSDAPNDKPRDDPPKPPGATADHFWRWILPLVILLSLWAFQRVDTGTAEGAPLPYSQLYTLVGEDKVERVTLTGHEGSSRRPRPSRGRRPPTSAPRSRRPPIRRSCRSSGSTRSS
jgi:hypothetical protein